MNEILSAWAYLAFSSASIISPPWLKKWIVLKVSSMLLDSKSKEMAQFGVPYENGNILATLSTTSWVTMSP